MQVTSQLVRKSLHTRIAEALDERGMAGRWEVAAGEDGRIAYVLDGIWRLPGEMATFLGIPVMDDGAWRPLSEQKED